MVVIGTYILLNLLVAVLLQLFSEDADGDGKSDALDFSSDDDKKKEEEKAEEEEAISAADEVVDGEPVKDVEGGKDDGKPKVRVDDPNDVALFFLKPNDPLRLTCQAIIEHTAVDYFLFAAVIISSGLLALDNPRNDPNSELSIKLHLANYGCTPLPLGGDLQGHRIRLHPTPNAYLKNGWNALDFALLVISVGGILSEVIPQLAFLRVLVSLRALRPLRLLSRNEGMKMVLASLVEALPAVANVFGVMIALQLVYAILGLQLFSGPSDRATICQLCIRRTVWATPIRRERSRQTGS